MSCADDCPASTHTTYSSYRKGCRSPEATAAEHRYQKAHRCGVALPRRVDALGTRRRIRALQAIGWRLRDISDDAGLPFKAMARYVVTDLVSRHTADRIAAAYERLSMTPGPNGKAVRHAARQGWPPPLAYDNIDDPLEQPTVGSDEHVPDVNLAFAAVADRLRWATLTRPDAEYVVTKLRHAGREVAEIADLLHCTPVDVTATWERIRARELRAARAAA